MLTYIYNCRFNIVAISEIYEGIKFQCCNCGQRFIRNETLKYHLDKHFADNNEIRKRKRVAPLMYPCHASALAAGAIIPFGQ